MLLEEIFPKRLTNKAISYFSLSSLSLSLFLNVKRNSREITRINLADRKVSAPTYVKLCVKRALVNRSGCSLCDIKQNFLFTKEILLKKLTYNTFAEPVKKTDRIIFVFEFPIMNQLNCT